MPCRFCCDFSITSLVAYCDAAGEERHPPPLRSSIIDAQTVYKLRNARPCTTPQEYPTMPDPADPIHPAQFPRILPAGDQALVVEFGDTISPGLHDRVLALDAALAEAAIPG